MKSGDHIVVSSGGLSVVSVLQIVFIILKLCGVISWHWALVMLPLTISVGLAVLAILIMLCIYGISSLIDLHSRKK